MKWIDCQQLQLVYLLLAAKSVMSNGWQNNAGLFANNPNQAQSMYSRQQQDSSNMMMDEAAMVDNIDLGAIIGEGIIVKSICLGWKSQVGKAVYAKPKSGSKAKRNQLTQEIAFYSKLEKKSQKQPLTANLLVAEPSRFIWEN